MPTISLGKRQRFAHRTSHALTERLVPPFLVRRVSGLFANAPMGFFWKYHPIRLPQVTVPDALAKRWRDAVPQASAGPFTVVANHTGQNVTCASQQARPEPAFVHPFPDETPGFIDFQPVLRLRGRERLLQRGQGVKFFLIQVARVSRERPTMRLIPHILGRSW